MNTSLILPASASLSNPHGHPLRRLLATTALTTILFAMPAGNKAMAQVIIGGDQQPPGVETFQQQLPALPQRDQWPYNVKTSKKADASVNPETLPSRQVSPKLMEAARLMQSGLTPAQVREAMTQPAPIMTAPELQGDKPDAPRDNSTTLPAVATGPLMASLADNDVNGAAPAATAPDVATADASAASNVLVPPAPVAAPMMAANDTTPSSLAMLGETPAVAAAPAAEAPKSTGRSLFGGKRVQVADATPMASSSRISSDTDSTLRVVDTGDHALHAPGESAAAQPEQKVASNDSMLAMPAPASSPAVDVAATPTPPVDMPPSDTARNSTPAKIAPLTSLSAPPKLLARIGDNSRGAVQRPASAAPVAPAAEPVPDAAPVAPVSPEPAKAPVKEAPAAVLPAKPDEPAQQAALVPMPQPQGDDDKTPDAVVAATPVAAAPAPAVKPEHKTFWNRLFGSSEDHPESKPAALPPVEAPKPITQSSPQVEPAYVAVAEPVVAAPTPAPMEQHSLRMPEPAPALIIAPVVAALPAVEPVAEPAPEPVNEPAPAPVMAKAEPVTIPEPPPRPAPKPTPSTHMLVTPRDEPDSVSMAAPTTAPIIEPVPEPTPAPKMAAAKQGKTPLPEGYVPSPSVVEQPAPAPAPAAVAAEVAPETPAPSMMRTAKAPEPALAVEAPAPVAIAEPTPEVVAPAETPKVAPAFTPIVETAAESTSQPKEHRTIWSDLFGDDTPKPAPAVIAPPVETLAAVEPAADEEPFEPIPTAGGAAPAVLTQPAVFGKSKSRQPVAEAEAPKPEDRPVAEAVVMPEPAPIPAAAPAAASPMAQDNPVVPPQPVDITEITPAPKAAKAKASPKVATASALPEGYVPSVAIEDPARKAARLSAAKQPAPVPAPAPEPVAAPVAEQVAAPVPLEPIPETRYIVVEEPRVIAPEPVAQPEPMPVTAPAYVSAATPSYSAPIPAPVAAPAPIVPAFRIEAPSTPGNSGLVTPRLVPVTPASAPMRAPQLVAAAPAATVSVPSGAPLAQVNFLPSSQSVDSVGQAQLQAIAEAMQMAPQTRLMLNAYAKAANDSESRRISLNRALVVRTKLAELGIQPSRVDVQALGQETPSDIDGGRDRVDAILH